MYCGVTMVKLSDQFYPVSPILFLDQLLHASMPITNFAQLIGPTPNPTSIASSPE